MNAQGEAADAGQQGWQQAIPFMLVTHSTIVSLKCFPLISGGNKDSANHSTISKSCWLLETGSVLSCHSFKLNEITASASASPGGHTHQAPPMTAPQYWPRLKRPAVSKQNSSCCIWPSLTFRWINNNSYECFYRLLILEIFIHVVFLLTHWPDQNLELGQAWCFRPGTKRCSLMVMDKAPCHAA